MTTDIKTTTPRPEPSFGDYFREITLEGIANLIKFKGWSVAYERLEQLSEVYGVKAEWAPILFECRKLIDKARLLALQEEKEQRERQLQQPGNQYFYVTSPNALKIGYNTPDQLENHFHNNVDKVHINHQNYINNEH